MTRPTCDGCKCRDDEIERLNAAIKQLTAQKQEMFDQMHELIDGVLYQDDNVRAAWLRGDISFADAIRGRVG